MKLPFRLLAERLSRKKTFWRRLPAAFDRKPIKVTPDSALRFLKPGEAAFDTMLLRLVDEYVGKGTNVWDIGANVGVLSLAAAVRGGNILGIEADAWLHSLLLETADHHENIDLSLTPLCAAIAADVGTVSLQIAVRGRSSSFIDGARGSTQTGGLRKSQLVAMLTLDLLLKYHEPPDLLKIDVEGAEALILKGASTIVNDIKPIILIEVQDYTRQMVMDTLLIAGYTISDYETGKLYTNHLDETGNNYLAVPS